MSIYDLEQALYSVEGVKHVIAKAVAPGSVYAIVVGGAPDPLRAAAGAVLPVGIALRLVHAPAGELIATAFTPR